MNKELNLHIDFSKNLTEKQQNDFWDEIVGLMESYDLRASGGHDSTYIDWVIDCRYSALDKGEIIDTIGDFLNEKEDLILNYKIE